MTRPPDQPSQRIPFLFRDGAEKAKRILLQKSLFRTVIIGLILASLVPVFLYGLVSYYRTRLEVDKLITTQLENISTGSLKQLENFIVVRANTLDAIVSDDQFAAMMQAIVHPESMSVSETSTAILQIRSYLVQESLGTGEAYFDQIMILDPEGRLVAASDSQWISDTFGLTVPGKHPSVREYANKGNISALLFSPYRTFKDRFVVVTARTFLVQEDASPYSILGYSSSRLFQTILEQAGSFFPGASAYYYFAPIQGTLGVGIGAQMQSLNLPSSAISSIMDGTQPGSRQNPVRYTSFEARPVISYLNTLPGTDLTLVIEVPERTASSLVPLFDTFNIYMLFISVVVLSILGYFTATRIIKPLRSLNQIANSYAQGDFTSRATLSRDDELGQLAGSMNRMANELDTLYSSLEEKVEQRTVQLRAASEVAQLATTTTQLNEILNKTVTLITQRFGYYHTSICLLDETGTTLRLREASGEVGQIRLRRARQIPLQSNEPSAWVAVNNQPRIIQDTLKDPFYQFDDLLPDTRSLAVIPIASGGEVLGVLDIRSTDENTFDNETVYVLQTLANQVAGALQKTRLLASTQVNLEETSLLYRLTRQIIAAADEKSVTGLLLDVMPQIPFTNAILTRDGDFLHILGLFDAQTGKFEHNLSAIDIPLQRIQQAFASGNPVMVEDITQPSPYDNILSFFLRRACKSAIILPTLVNGELVKILVIGFHEEADLNQARIQPYINLAEIVTTTLEKLSVTEHLERRLMELQILSNFSKATSSETDLNRLYHMLHEQVKETIGSDIGFIIALYDEPKKEINIPYAYEAGEMLSLGPLPLGQGLTSYVIQTRKPLLLERDTERRAAEMGARIYGRPARSWLGIPLMVAGDLVGALIMQDNDREERFGENNLNLFVTVAPHIATSIRNAQLVDAMQAALRAGEDERTLFNTYLAYTPDVITIKDAHGIILRASHSVETYFGVRVDEIVGESETNLLNPEQASRSTVEDLEIIEDGLPRLGLSERTGDADNSIWFSTSKIPIRAHTGEPAGIITIRRDITELKKSENEAKRRADEILIAAEIARDASGTLDLDQLLEKAVNLVRDRFGFYHASIFLVDPLNQYAVLRESTGEAGRLMKEKGHRLAIGSMSIVGQATAKGEAVIVHDVTDDPTHLPNPLLPSTRAEMALPMKIGDRILGALDVQSTQAGAFGAEDISILGMLADQLAIAIDNARLFMTAKNMLGMHQKLQNITVAASTAKDIDEALERTVSALVTSAIADRASIYINAQGNLILAAASGYAPDHLPNARLSFDKGIGGSAAQERKPVLVLDTSSDPRYLNLAGASRSELALPVIFGEDLMGILTVGSDQVANFDQEDQEIMLALANNIAAVIANWRLVSQIQRQVDRQERLFTAAAKIRRSVDIDTILQVSVNEIGRAVGAQRARISLTTGASRTPLSQDFGAKMNENTAVNPEYRKNGIDGANGKGTG